MRLGGVCPSCKTVIAVTPGGDESTSEEEQEAEETQLSIDFCNGCGAEWCVHTYRLHWNEALQMDSEELMEEIHSVKNCIAAYLPGIDHRELIFMRHYLIQTAKLCGHKLRVECNDAILSARVSNALTAEQMRLTSDELAGLGAAAVTAPRLPLAQPRLRRQNAEPVTAGEVRRPREQPEPERNVRQRTEQRPIAGVIDLVDEESSD